jgi:GNAT superfamily N-acetyltransferase
MARSRRSSSTPTAPRSPASAWPASCAARRSPDAAEIAITIVDDWQGLGIGRILLHRLLAMVSERGIPYVDGRLQAENRRMRHLLEPYVPEGGFRREDSTLTFRFPVPAHDDPLMAQLARNAAAVVGMFKRMAEGRSCCRWRWRRSGCNRSGPRRCSRNCAGRTPKRD